MALLPLTDGQISAIRDALLEQSSRTDGERGQRLYNLAMALDGLPDGDGHIASGSRSSDGAPSGVNTRIPDTRVLGRLAGVTSQSEWQDGSGRSQPLDYEVTIVGPGWRLEVEHVPAGTPLPELGGELRLTFSDDMRAMLAPVTNAVTNDHDPPQGAAPNRAGKRES